MSTLLEKSIKAADYTGSLSHATNSPRLISGAKCKMSPLYRPGDLIVFKSEGNVRAEVTRRRILDGKLWLGARAADLTFLVLAQQVVGVEPKGRPR